jgi:hypothetical protein
VQFNFSVYYQTVEAKHKHISRVQTVHQGRNVHHTDNTNSDTGGEQTRPAAAALEDLTQIQTQHRVLIALS